MSENTTSVQVEQTKNRTLKKRLLATIPVCLICLPFAMAFVAHAHGSTLQQMEVDVDRPGLSFSQYYVNLGPVAPSPVIGARFTFKNVSDRTVTIKEVATSCGCLKPRLAKKIYKPGEVGEFILPVETPSQKPGPKEYWIDVTYEDSKVRNVMLSFKAILPEKQVMVQPKALIVYQFGTRKTERSISVLDYPDTGLKLISAHCDSKLIRVRMGNQNLKDNGHRKMQVDLTIDAKIPPGKHISLLTIKTDHPRYREIHVPIHIYGPAITTTSATEVSQEKQAKSLKR